MWEYHDLLRDVLKSGHETPDRTGVGTLSVFGRQLRFDLGEGLPVVTTKRVHLKSVIAELLWFIAGGTNVWPLNDDGVTIWDEWADEDGDLGPIYGKQWRCWEGYEDVSGEFTPIYDQLMGLVVGLRENPHSRRHIVSAWNVADLDQMALPPCHALFQCHVDINKRLSLQVYQRSADLFLGVPFNIASYAILTHLLCHVTGYKPGDLIMSFGDVHIYTNHLNQVNTQLQRNPRQLPKIDLSDAPRDLFDICAHHIKIDGYDPHPAIKAKVAV